jgi:tetratricopeptide (TPR) repeat protein
MSRAAVVHLGLARILRWFGWRGGAASACRDAIAARPDWAEAHLELGETLADLSEWELARESFEKAIRLQPNNAEARGNLVVAFTRLGRAPEAVAALEGLAHHHPHDIEVQLLLGTLYRRARRHDDAVRAFRRAVQLPAPPRGRRCWLGPALLGADEWETVMASCRHASAGESGVPAAADAPSWHSALNRHPGRTKESRRGGAAPRYRLRP